ncbi:MAG: hypothetical protein ACYDG2_17380 [Ruminiclostridium sp.]
MPSRRRSQRPSRTYTRRVKRRLGLCRAAGEVRGLVALILGGCKEDLACAEPQAKSEALVALILGECKEND